jgi:hypothetical protein
LDYSQDWQARFVYTLRNDVRLEDYVCGEPHGTSPEWRAAPALRVVPPAFAAASATVVRPDIMPASCSATAAKMGMVSTGSANLAAIDTPPSTEPRLGRRPLDFVFAEEARLALGRRRNPG